MCLVGDIVKVLALGSTGADESFPLKDKEGLMKKKLLALLVMGMMLLITAAPTFAFGGGEQ
jgi:hypothetical protein